MPRKGGDRIALETAARALLKAIGEDVNRPGLIDTPRRFADMWQEFIDFEPGNTDTVFDAVQVDQMVVLRGIKVWSMCEHHLLPFWCEVSIGYVSHEHVVGISKFARIADKHAHRLQLQERMCRNIADEVLTVTRSPDVAVIARGGHLCMAMRGVKSDAEMISSDLRGVLQTSSSARAEFMRLAGF